MPVIPRPTSPSVNISDNTYDAVVGTGTLASGHVGPDAFDELIRITKPGGHIVFTVRKGAYEDHDYRKHMIELEQDKAWALLALYDEEYLRNAGVGCKMCSFKVLRPRA